MKRAMSVTYNQLALNKNKNKSTVVHDPNQSFNRSKNKTQRKNSDCES